MERCSIGLDLVGLKQTLLYCQAHAGQDRHALCFQVFGRSQDGYGGDEYGQDRRHCEGRHGIQSRQRHEVGCRQQDDGREDSAEGRLRERAPCPAVSWELRSGVSER